MTASYTPESASALLALVGVSLNPARAASVAATLSTQVAGANLAFVSLSFETEPATYLKVLAEEAP